MRRVLIMKLRVLFLFTILLALVSVHSKTTNIAEGITISGFVDTSYYSNALDGSSTFGLDQAEVDFEKTVEGLGGLRLDLQHLNNTDTGDEVMEQGYVWLDLTAGTNLTFGKFNAPIGFELGDPNEMYQFSHAMVFDYGLPGNLTGAMVSGGSGIIDFAVYAVNGWDLIADDNKEKTIGGRIGLTPMEGVNLGVSHISGKEGAASDNLSVLDVDLTITTIENLTIGGEFNSGTHAKASVVTAGADATWAGWLVMANYAFTDKVALTLRYDEFDDKDGARLGSGITEKRNAVTISPSYAIGDGFGVLAEYRLTKSNQKVFADADGNLQDSISEMAVEFTYSF
tara:strand:+ start:160755 stop:161777 length:1023 start_codon:yes stop_codon:yes gene_type:complete